MKPDYSRKRQKSTVVVALLMFSFVLIVLQLWLVSDGLERAIVGDAEPIVPGALVCFGIFMINVWMLAGILAVDRAE